MPVLTVNTSNGHGGGASDGASGGSAWKGTASRAGSEFRWFQRRTLLVLYLAYATYYLSRKADSAVKSSLHELGHFSVEELAFADTTYLAVYTVSIGCSGIFGSYVPSAKLLR